MSGFVLSIISVTPMVLSFSIIDVSYNTVSIIDVKMC